MESALWALIAASMGMSLLCDHFFPSLSCIFAAGLGALLIPSTETFQPDAFLYIIVPPVVLQSGLSYKWSRRRSKLTLFMAWAGTTITTAWTTFGLFTMRYTGLSTAAALAAVCSPTDTVSTGVLTRRADPDLRRALQHESLLNDAVGFLFTHLFAHADGLEASSIAVLVLTIIGSAAVGLFTSHIHITYTEHGAVSTLVCVLFLYSIVEWAHGSGILALFLFGIYTRQWREHDMEALTTTLDVIVDVLEKYVYVTMGTTLRHIEPGHVGVAAVVLASLYTSRIFHVTLGGCLIRGITLEEGIFLIGCNVRGAFTIALASLSGIPMFQSVAILIVIWTHVLGLITIGPIGTILDII